MGAKWLVIGVSGVTCGGKTTIANELHKLFPGSRVISQDDYFLPVDDPRHVWIEELNHINFDVLSSLDMEKMHSDIQHLLTEQTTIHNNSKHETPQFSNGYDYIDLQKFVAKAIDEQNVKILIVEGFSIFKHRPIEKLCDLKYFVTLNHDECYVRRTKRVYEPPDCPGYFERCVWPEYSELYDYVKDKVKDVVYFSEFTKDPVRRVMSDVAQALS